MALYVREVVREVVETSAPHEVPVLDGLHGFSDGEALRVLHRTKQKREPLGFGFAEAGALVTAIVWVILDQAVRHAVDRTSETVITRGSERFRRLLRRGPAQDPHLPMVVLEPDELAMVRSQILERAVERGMHQADAEALADSVVARIVTAQPPQNPPSRDTAE